MLHDNVAGSGDSVCGVPKLVLYLRSNRFLQKVLSLLKARALALTRLVVCVKCMDPPSLQRPARSDLVCGAQVRHWKTNRGTVSGNVLEPQLLDRFPAMSELILPPLVNPSSCKGCKEGMRGKR